MGNRLYILVGGPTTHSGGYGCGEAINLPQLEVLGLDWKPGGVDLDLELEPPHNQGAAHTPRYPDSVVLV